MSFTTHVLFSVSLVKLKTEGQTLLTEKLENWNQNSC